jgi:hypothetical protein
MWAQFVGNGAVPWPPVRARPASRLPASPQSGAHAESISIVISVRFGTLRQAIVVFCNPQSRRATFFTEHLIRSGP